MFQKVLLIACSFIFTTASFGEERTPLERDVQLVRDAMKAVKESREIEDLKGKLDILNATLTFQDKERIKIPQNSFGFRKSKIIEALRRAKDRKLIKGFKVENGNTSSLYSGRDLLIEIDDEYYRIDFLLGTGLRISKYADKPMLPNPFGGLEQTAKSFALTDSLDGQDYRISVREFFMGPFSEPFVFFTGRSYIPGFHPTLAITSSRDKIREEFSGEELLSLSRVKGTDFNSQGRGFAQIGSFPFAPTGGLLPIMSPALPNPHLALPKPSANEVIQKPENESNSESSSEEGSHSQRFVER